MSHLPASETHFKRELIDFKRRTRVFTKSATEKDQLKRAKKNKRTLPPRGLIVDYMKSGEPMLIEARIIPMY